MSTWVFLRGLTRESAHWGSFLAHFQRSLPEARIIALDLPGTGVRCGERSPLDVRGMVEACRGELAARGEAGPFRLLGMSLGAMVAAEWAVRAPDEVVGCVLINTSFRPFSPFSHRLRPANYFRLFRMALPWTSSLERETLVLLLTSVHWRQRRYVLNDWLEVAARRPVSRLNAVRQLVAASRFMAPPAAPACPVMLLAGAADRLVDPRCTDRIAAHWGCEVRIHPHAGHDLALDDAAWVAETVRRWARAAASAAGVAGGT